MIEKLWSADLFPIVYENDKAKAVIVDMESFEKLGMILDNLVNRCAESEDSLLAASGLLEKLVDESKKISPSDNWKSELDEL
ncbi:MAG: hypothetical protein GY749_15505 [Desulfobacteraceae bacterium]|nr:hypothetical protein [Desulfobacteraceae bacterium]